LSWPEWAKLQFDAGNPWAWIATESAQGALRLRAGLDCSAV